VPTFTQLASGNWCVQVRRKTRYVAETFRRRKDSEEWALEMERNIDRMERQSHAWFGTFAHWRPDRPASRRLA
jgi:hypothetical protein